MLFFYSKKFLKIITIFSSISVLLLLFRAGHRTFILINNASDFLSESHFQLFKYYFVIIESIVFSGIFIFLIFRPEKFIMIGIISLCYSFDYLLTNYQLPFLGIPMFTLGIATFAVRGFFKNNTKIKISVFLAIYILSLIIPVFYDPNFGRNFIIKIAISIVTFVSLFFTAEYTKQNGSKDTSKEKILNIASFKGLDRSDMYLLQDVLEYKKYKEIAQKIHGSEGALRNKLSKIYKILEVGDRTGFLTIYSGYKLIYEPEQIAVNN